MTLSWKACTFCRSGSLTFGLFTAPDSSSLASLRPRNCSGSLDRNIKILSRRFPGLAFKEPRMASSASDTSESDR
eukprot:scaffold870_cov268-Pinguiococcus_pyrenoidosus.AAC.59